MERITGKNAMAPRTAGVKREAPHTAGVGNERSADMGGAINGSPTDGLKGAVGELRAQHPIAYHDHGPHHGTDHHVRHQPLHGLKTEGMGHHAEKMSPSQRERYGR